MYQIVGRDVLLDWLAKEADPGRRQTMLDWLTEFAEAPLENAIRVPGVRAQVYLVATLVVDVAIRFLFDEQFRCIKLIRFVDLG